MEFMFHDTSGPPTHANNMPPSSAPWLAPSPAFLPQWSYSAPAYPHYDANNTAYASSYAPLPSTAHYMSSGVSGAARQPTGLGPNGMPTSSWPPSSVQQPTVNNLPVGPFGTMATANVNAQNIRFAAAGRANRPSSTQTPSAFVQTAGTTHVHALPRAVNPQSNAASHVQLNPESLAFLPTAASSRPLSTIQANQETLRGHQTRNRVSQIAQHGHSSPGKSRYLYVFCCPPKKKVKFIFMWDCLDAAVVNKLYFHFGEQSSHCVLDFLTHHIF